MSSLWNSLSSSVVCVGHFNQYSCPGWHGEPIGLGWVDIDMKARWRYSKKPCLKAKCHILNLSEHIKTKILIRNETTRQRQKRHPQSIFPREVIDKAVAEHHFPGCYSFFAGSQEQNLHWIAPMLISKRAYPQDCPPWTPKHFGPSLPREVLSVT